MGHYGWLGVVLSHLSAQKLGAKMGHPGLC
jgi:hypothetical protein